MQTYNVTIEHFDAPGHVVTDTIEVEAKSRKDAYDKTVRQLIEAAEVGFWVARIQTAAELRDSLRDIEVARDEG